MIVKLKIVLIISAVTTALFLVVMNLHGHPLKIENVTPYGIIDLEMARTIARATDIYNNWLPDLTHRAIKNTFIDFLFLISYGTFLYAACCTFSKSFPHTMWKRIGHYLSILMIVAACFDALENFLMLRTLYGHFNKEIIASTFVFASLKFLLVGLGILYLISSTIASMFYVKKKSVEMENFSFDNP